MYSKQKKRKENYTKIHFKCIFFIDKPHSFGLYIYSLLHFTTVRIFWSKKGHQDQLFCVQNQRTKSGSTYKWLGSALIVVDYPTHFLLYITSPCVSKTCDCIAGLGTPFFSVRYVTFFSVLKKERYFFFSFFSWVFGDLWDPKERSVLF